jgi:uncharacterized protein (TIGR02466 family)
MAIHALFPTLVYRAPLTSAANAHFDQRLHDECEAIAASDSAGRRWSTKHYVGGYTSYGSLDRLHLVSPLFDRLRRHIDRHVALFVRSLQYDLSNRRVAMSDCWLNRMPGGIGHSLHLHPASFISGTYYVVVPKGAGALKFEDPRLSRLMAAPPRRADAPRAVRPFVSMAARSGDLILFESWLRHEVPPARYVGERVSISFNYTWVTTPTRAGARNS